ncbi:MAG TPA: hypothetical protein VM432_01225 [Bdellovibrionales bacterium]|nr:hypothetical protein [Bdellovibrionales bacterium]
MKAFKTALIILGTLASQSAFAVERQLVNDALNKALMEHASVEAGWEENAEAARPSSQSRAKAGRIEVVIDSEIGGTNSSLKHLDSEEVYREKRVQVKLDQELSAIEKALAEKTDKKTEEKSN